MNEPLTERSLHAAMRRLRDARSEPTPYFLSPSLHSELSTRAAKAGRTLREQIVYEMAEEGRRRSAEAAAAAYESMSPTLNEVIAEMALRHFRAEHRSSGDRRASNLGWLADLDEDQEPGMWQPVLQLDGWAPRLDVWFRTEEECLAWIKTDVIGKGMMQESRTA